VISLIPPGGLDVFGRRQAWNYGFFYGVYYYPRNLNDFMPIGFEAGAL